MGDCTLCGVIYIRFLQFVSRPFSEEILPKIGQSVPLRQFFAAMISVFAL